MYGLFSQRLNHISSSLTRLRPYKDFSVGHCDRF
jgi:hypothetical protein